MYFIRSGRVRLEAGWRVGGVRTLGLPPPPPYWSTVVFQVLGRKEHEIVEAGTTLGDMAVLDQASFSEKAFNQQKHAKA